MNHVNKTIFCKTTPLSRKHISCLSSHKHNTCSIIKRRKSVLSRVGFVASRGGKP